VRSPARVTPPARSSPSWLWCIGRWLLQPLRDEGQRRLGVHRVGEVEALAEVAAKRSQRLRLFGQLDALGNDLERQGGAQPHDGIGEAVRAGSGALVQERAIHLEDVDGKPAEVAQGGVPRAEVIEREGHAERLEITQTSDGEV